MGLSAIHAKKKGWIGSEKIIIDALNKMEFEENASIIAIGSGIIEFMHGASWEAIHSALAKSNKNLTIWAN